MQEQLQHLPIKDIRPEKNIREINWDHVEQLTENIQMHGVINPVTVRKNGSGYILVAGFHRYEAAKKAGMSQLPSKIVGNVDEKSAGYISLSENIVRRDMSWPEQVAAVRILKDSAKLSSEDLAKKLSIHKSTAADMLLISELPQEYIEKGANNPPLRSEFRRYARLPNERREELLKNIIAIAKNNDGKYPSAPSLEKAINRLEVGLVNACFDTNECSTCPHNTACQTSMFADTDVADGLCQKPECYDEKTQQALQIEADKAHQQYNIPESQQIVADINETITDAIIHVQDIEFRAWNPEQLGEAAHGCADCEQRMIIVKQMATSCLAKPFCQNPSCYNDLIPSDDEPSAQSAASNSPVSNAKAECKKNSNQVTPELKNDSRAIVAYRRTIVEKAVLNAIQDTSDAGALLRCMTTMLTKQNTHTLKSIDLDQTPNLNPKDIQEIFRDYLLNNVKTMDAEVLLANYQTIVGEEELRTQATVTKHSFLESLTRSELLGILVEAHANTDMEPKQWKSTLKMKKEELIETIMAYSFTNEFLPSVLIPSKSNLPSKL